MKTILIYATKYGCTFEVAKRVQEQLGEEVRLCNIQKESVPSLESFDTVVLGGSIYIGMMQKQLKEFAASHLDELLHKNVGLFICAGEANAENRTKELSANFPEALLGHAAAKDVLGCAFQFDKMKLLDRIIMKKIKGDDHSVTEYYDDRIALFANALKTKGNKV